MKQCIPSFELRGIDFSYDPGHLVFRGLDFTMSGTDQIALTGPNGSGKSTLLKLLVGLVAPVAGAVWAFGAECRQEKDFRAVRARAGLLFQDPEDQLFCPTVKEDVAFGPLNLGRSRQETGDIVERTLNVLGLDGYEERITHHLSGGEKRLVALATVLAMEPDVLLLDEPTCGLDDTTEARLQSVLGELPQGMIIASHDRRFLDTLCNRQVELQNGRLSETAASG